MATLYRCLIALNGSKGPKYYQAGDGVTKPSYLVMEDDADEVKVCSTSGKPIGVAGCPAYQDLNTVFTAGNRIPVYLLNTGVEIYVLHDGNSAESVIKGIKLQASSSTAGTVRIKPAYTAKTTTYNLAQFTERGDTDNFVIGRATETVTITSGTTQFIKALLE
jgi:hypothetical protein